MRRSMPTTSATLPSHFLSFGLRAEAGRTLALLAVILAAVPTWGQAKPASDATIIEAIRETAETTPAGRLRSAETLLNLGHPELARERLQAIAAAPLSPEQADAVLREVGSARLFRFSLAPTLQPEGKQVADSILAGADRWQTDPQRLAATIQALRGDDDLRARKAMHQLRGGSAATVGPLLLAIQKETNPTVQARLRRTIAQLGSVATTPLMGAMMTDQPGLRVEAMNLLAELNIRESAPYLLRATLGPSTTPIEQQVASRALHRLSGGVPSLAEAEVVLERQVQTRLAYQESASKHSGGMTETVWRWNGSPAELAADTWLVSAARLDEAAWLARDWVALAPERPDARIALWAAHLAAKKLRYGIDQRLAAKHLAAVMDITDPNTPALLEQVLACSLQRDWEASAVGAIEAMGQCADGGQSAVITGSDRPLVASLRSSSRRVRIAAAWALLRWTRAGSGDLSGAEPQWSRTLAHVAATQGGPRILIGSPDAAQGDQLASLVRGLGFSVDTARTGQQLCRRLINNPDYELVFVVDTLDFPAAREVVQHLRQHPHTARLPVALLSSADRMALSEWVGIEDPLTLIYPRLHDAETAEILLRRLIQLPHRERLTSADRVRHGVLAAQWLALAQRQGLIAAAQASPRAAAEERIDR